MTTTPTSGSLRVIGGKWRSRKLTFPAAPGLRPTADRIRETLFNWLQNDVDLASCLDLFAGSGACGIEALSRGAARSVFVESNAAATRAIQDSLQALDCKQGTVVRRDVLDWLRSRPPEYQGGFDLVFIDPPYATDLQLDTAIQLENSGVLKARARIYIESDKELDLQAFPATWENVRHKKAGIVHYYLFNRKTLTP
jgi:16S rRNA (guanine966-N2)-methyltransferase